MTLRGNCRKQSTVLFVINKNGKTRVSFGPGVGTTVWGELLTQPLLSFDAAPKKSRPAQGFPSNLRPAVPPKKKQKVGKTKPGAANATDVSFQAKRVCIREQNIQSHRSGETVSENLRKRLVMCCHYNRNTRKAAQNISDIRPVLPNLFETFSKLTVDEESSIRALVHTVVALLFSAFEPELMEPFMQGWLSFLQLTLTHISLDIRVDGLRLLEMTIEHVKTFSAVLGSQKEKFVRLLLDINTSKSSTTKRKAVNPVDLIGRLLQEEPEAAGACYGRTDYSWTLFQTRPIRLLPAKDVAATAKGLSLSLARDLESRLGPRLRIEWHEAVIELASLDRQSQKTTVARLKSLLDTMASIFPLSLPEMLAKEMGKGYPLLAIFDEKDLNTMHALVTINLRLWRMLDRSDTGYLQRVLDGRVNLEIAVGFSKCVACKPERFKDLLQSLIDYQTRSIEVRSLFMNICFAICFNSRIASPGLLWRLVGAALALVAMLDDSNKAAAILGSLTRLLLRYPTAEFADGQCRLAFSKARKKMEPFQDSNAIIKDSLGYLPAVLFGESA